MDTLTHALSGALLARATAPSVAAQGAIPLRRRVALGALAAAFPDIDGVTSAMSPLAYLYHHRGVTHSWVMLVLWAVVLAWLCSKIWRGAGAEVAAVKRAPSWKAYFGVIAGGIAVHILGDWITSFGTMMFAPLSDARMQLGTTFIIDLWFSGIIIAGLLASLIWRASRAPAAAGLAVLCAYVVFQYAQMQRAVTFGESYARTNGLMDAKVTALPRPVSPFHWMVIVEEPERYRYAMVSLSRTGPPVLAPGAGFFTRLAAPYLPLSRARWQAVERFGSPDDATFAREAFSHRDFEFFHWFARYPALYRVETGKPSACAWFQDLRFLTPGRATWPFRYGMCRDASGQWRPYELLSDNDTIPVH